MDVLSVTALQPVFDIVRRTRKNCLIQKTPKTAGRILPEESRIAIIACSLVHHPEECFSLVDGGEGERLVAVEAEEVEGGALGELVGSYLGLTKGGGLGGVVVVAGLVRPVGQL